MTTQFELVRRSDGWIARLRVDSQRIAWETKPTARWRAAIQAIEAHCGAGVRWHPIDDIIRHPDAGDVYIVERDER